MKFKKLLALVTVIGAMVLVSCENESFKKDGVSEEAISKIYQLGFSTDNVIRV